MQLPYLQKAHFLLENRNRSDRGFVAFISVLIISALILVVISSANLASISEADMGLDEQQSWEAFYLATACVEEALIRLKEDLKYKGGDNFTFDNGECTILDVRGGGNNNRTVMVSGSVYNKIRRVMVEINEVNPTMDLRSWSEVTNF